MSGRDLRVGEFVRLGKCAHRISRIRMGDRLARVILDDGPGHRYRYDVAYFDPEGRERREVCGRKELVIARPSDDELAAWLEKEITR